MAKLATHTAISAPTASPKKPPTVLAPVPSTLKTVGTEETFSTKCDVNGKKASAAFAVRPKEGKDVPRYVIETTIDFSNVTEAELIALACRPVIIDVQRRFRVKYNGKGRAEALAPSSWRFTSVRDYLDAERTRAPADPVLAARRHLAKLAETDPKALAAIIAEMGKATSGK